MASLIQKNHGLPGVGVNGEVGQTGDKGNSIYFGYVNDFFDGVKIDMDNYIYIARRIKDNFSAWEQQVHNLNQALLPEKAPANIIDILDTSVYTYYYTGSIYEYDEKYSADIDTSSALKTLGQYKIDFSNDSQLMGILINSADGNTVTFKYNQSVFPYKNQSASSPFSNNITEIKVSVSGGQTLDYTQLYDYDVIGNTAKLKENEQVRMLGNDGRAIITYDSNDAAYLAYQHTSNNFNDKWLFDSGNVSMKYNLVMTYLDSVLNQTDNKPLSYSTAVKEIISYQTSQGDYKLLTETNLFQSIFSVNDKSVYRNLITDYDYLCNNSESINFDPNQYFKTSVILNYKNKLSDTDIIMDDDKYSYYGITSGKLFTSNINDLVSVKTINSEAFNNYSKLSSGINDYKKDLNTYQNLTRNDIYVDNGYIRYIQHDEDQKIIPTTLSEYYKAGDILYFSIDESNKDVITYMVVLTDNMLKCKKSQLIKYAQLVKPFGIKYFDSIQNHVLNTNGIIIIKNDIDTSIDKYYTHSIASILDKYNDTGLILADCSANPHIMSLTVAPSLNTSYYMNSIIDSSYLKITDNGRDIKLQSLYIKNDKVINAEKYEYLHDENIILDGDFIKSIESMKTFNDANGMPYIGTYLFATDYFYNCDDLSEYLYGYDVMDDNMMMLQQRYTNNDQLDLFIPVTVSDTCFYIMLWASNATGIKHYSRLMYVDVKCEMVAHTVNFPIIQSVTTTATTSEQKNKNDMSLANALKKSLNASSNRISLTKLQENSNLLASNPLNKKINVSTSQLALNSKLQKQVQNQNNVNQAVQQLKKITATQNSSTIYSYIVSKCDIYTQGDNNQFKKINLNGIADYALTDTLNVEKNTSVGLHISIIDDNYKLQKVYFNVQNVSVNSSIAVNDWAVIDCSSLSEYILNIDSNIPGYDYLNDYVHSKSSLSDNGDSSLFVDIVNGDHNVQTNDRSILLTVGYNDSIDKYILFDHNNLIQYYQLYPYSASVFDTSNTDITSDSIVYYKDFNTDNVIIKIFDTSYYKVNIQPGEGVNFYFTKSPYNYVDVTNYIKYVKPDIYYESFKITQPGFKDTRDVPDISLNMHNEMIDVQTYNSFENNVLCNQFITYMDINVNDFKQKWGQFVNNDSSILLSFHVKNIQSDIDWQSKNIIDDGIYRHATMKFVFENPTDNFTQNENYVLLHPSLIKTDKDLIYITNDEEEYIDDNICSIDTSIHLYKVKSENPVDVSIYDVSSKKYVLLDSSVVEYNNHPEYIYSGLQEDIDLYFKNINIDDLNDNTLHLKLLYEFGNPAISNLYLRFAVTNIDISVYTNTASSRFTAKVPNVISDISSRRLLDYNSNNDYSYTYISDPLNIMTNPLSYTVCPAEYETDMSNMQGSLYKVGSDKQIITSMKFFNSSIYDKSLLMDTESKEIRRNLYLNWSSAKLKKSYFQDNIQNIALQTANSISDISDDNLFKLLCDNIGDTDVLNNLNTKYNYIGIVYNGGIMNSKLRDGIYNFYYNNTLFELDRYSQYANQSPAFVNDGKQMNIRNDELFKAVQVWNKEYVNAQHYDKDVTFTGSISLYGNGYSQLLSTADENQYDGNALTLQETKDLNNVYIYNSSVYNDIYNDNVNENTPENKHYYRSFLYDLNMEYCMNVSDTEYKPYQIVNNFDILLQYMDNIGKGISKYADKLNLLNDKNENIIPYTLLYKLYPRICYNIDNQSLNVLMLRMPTIEYDTDVTLSDDASVWGCYNLNKHYFELMPNQNIEKIKNNYKI